MDSPILLHIPHSSTIIPKEYKTDFIVDLSNELRFMTDWYTDELFDYPAAKLIFPISRLVCDVERFRDNRREEMSRCGMGACYTHGFSGTRIRSLSREKEEQILRRWYDPHHAALTKKAAENLDHWGVCLIIDCHSFHPSPLPYEPDKRSRRPDICIGADPFHTPRAMVERLSKTFSRKGYRVAVNTPYAGAMVPAAYYQQNANVISIMIEVNRSLYLDRDFLKKAAFPFIKYDIQESIDELKTWIGY
ncbi:MAG: N-formylglutamate amidohydrolase [Oscillospiraceae bacterium]|nr:N-formylglutamate amidohydrolase [Oscillospiraceae bacterium]